MENIKERRKNIKYKKEYDYIIKSIIKIKKGKNFNKIKSKVLKRLEKIGFNEEEPQQINAVNIEQVWYELLSKKNKLYFKVTIFDKIRKWTRKIKQKIFHFLVK